MTDNVNDVDAESAVRQYLLYLEDPSQLKDEAEVQRRTQDVLNATDPIDKLHALTELRRVANIEEGPLRERFVAVAKRWADGQNIPAAAFSELQVTDQVLRQAGFSLPSGTGDRRRVATSEGPRQRAKAVPVPQIKDYVRKQQATFVLRDIQEGLGGSPATVRKAVEGMVDAGEVERLGTMTDYQGRGRAPVQYRYGGQETP